MEFDFKSIDEIINARSLAIVGASGSPLKFGTMLTSSQLETGFDGDLYLVNPKESKIMGLKAYPDLQSLPGAPDLVYIAIPAHRSVEVLEACAQIGVKGVALIASGFREIGAEGLALERAALGIARDGGFRVIGPNCFGIYNPRTGLTMLPGHDFSREPGGTAFISQSGGFSAHVVRQGQSLGLRFRAAVSYGNAADLDEVDLLKYFTLDEGTSVISGYIEGASRGDEFADAFREAASTKPVVVWKVGRGEASRRAVLSHTGSLSGQPQVWEGLIKQCGAIAASGVDELCDILLGIEHLGFKPGRRLLLVGGGGGLGTYAADLAEAEGLAVPPLSREAESALKQALSRAGAAVGNPLDYGAPLIPAEEFEGTIRAAAADSSTDIVVVDIAINFAFDIAGERGLDIASDVLVDARKRCDKPIAAVLYTRSFDAGNLTSERLLRRIRSKLHSGGIAVFDSMQRAMRAIAKINP